MKFKVRSKDGELDYPSFKEVEQAWLMGLIEPDDELLEEGKTVWRKASTVPLLAKARRTGEQAWGGAWFLWTLIGVMGGSAALWLLNSKATESRIAGVVVAFIVALVMIKVTQRAFQRSKPHG